ncbi:NUD13 protein, partial [Amia calva]|nr:NUD13 protein [Amia calva]
GQAQLRWHQTHGYCSAIGQPTERNQTGSQRTCQASGATYYPQMAPVVITLVSDGACCLLARQASFPLGMYSTLAGFCDTVLQVSLWAEPLVVLYSALSVLLHSLSLGWLAKVGEQQQCEPDGRASALDLHFTLCVDSSLALGLLCLLLPGGLSELGQGSWHSLLFLGYLLGVLALGALQSLLLSLVALCCSPVAAGVLHTALDLTLPLRSLL